MLASKETLVLIDCCNNWLTTNLPFWAKCLIVSECECVYVCVCLKLQAFLDETEDLNQGCPIHFI